MDSSRRAEIRRIAVSAGVVAAALVLNLALLFLPNVEVFTLAFFFVGYIFGAGWGALVAALGEALYSGLNPFGMAPLPVFTAQMLGMALAGALGGIYRIRVKGSMPAGVGVRLWPALLGALAALIFDTLTNAATALVGPFEATLAATMLVGLPFMAIHVAANALLFYLFFPTMTRLTKPHQ